MKKTELLNYFDKALMDKLYGFCYARTNDSYEAQDLCSEIILKIVKAANSEGEIEAIYPFIWKVARNVYADYSADRRQRHDAIYDGDPDEILPLIAAEDEEDDTEEKLKAVYRRISFLTKAYRDVMILFYLEGKTTADIAKELETSETAVRQRLFSARKKIKNEVEAMTENINRPANLNNIEFDIWGTGNPNKGDPRNVAHRQFSKHIVWLCRKKPMSAAEIAEELNVPTVYVEEELEILARGEDWKYGLLRKLDNRKYVINFVLLDEDEIEKAYNIYKEKIPAISDGIIEYIEEKKDEYLSFPYLNKKVDLNLILWQQIFSLTYDLAYGVRQLLKKKYFSDIKEPDRPFSVFGKVDTGVHYGGGWDGVGGSNVCGFSRVHAANIYITRIRAHFHCGLNISDDPIFQMALKAIDGIDVNTLSETDKEHAAKAIECGYIYREGDILYTKILVSDLKNEDDLFKISNNFKYGNYEKDCEEIAEKMAAFIKKVVPEHLKEDWMFVNRLANQPVLDTVVEALIEKGVLTPPENGLGAEGCWVQVER